METIIFISSQNSTFYREKKLSMTRLLKLADDYKSKYIYKQMKNILAIAYIYFDESDKPQKHFFDPLNTQSIANPLLQQHTTYTLYF